MPVGRGGQALERSRSWGSTRLKSQRLTSQAGVTRCRKMDLFRGAMGGTLELSRGRRGVKRKARQPLWGQVTEGPATPLPTF